MNSPRIFAIVPAAGRSQRMGRPKLLLPWGDSTIIACVLRAWCESEVSHVVVVIRKDDEVLARACQGRRVELVRPDLDPTDMKQSIQHGLRHVADFHRPTAEDHWMVAPADLPRLSSDLVNRVAAHADGQGCVVPRFDDRQGHPVMLPWSLSADVFALPENQGLDRILARQGVNFVDFAAEQRVADVDTPAEYDSMRGA